MAWISVHEDIIGGKLRELSKSIGCSQNEALGILLRLWLWCINNADKHGYIIGADRADVEEILNIGKEKSLDAGTIVQSLIDCSWIDSEEDSLYIHDWEEWQEPLYTFKERREKDRDRKRKLLKVAHPEETPSEATAAAETPVQTDNKPDPPKEIARKEYRTDFMDFWGIYPRKADKGKAYVKYMARLKDGFRPEQLIQAARNYRAKCERERTAQKYILHAKTFLSDTMTFLDYLPDQSEAGDREVYGYTDDGQNPWH